MSAFDPGERLAEAVHDHVRHALHNATITGLNAGLDPSDVASSVHAGALAALVEYLWLNRSEGVSAETLIGAMTQGSREMFDQAAAQTEPLQ